MGIELNRGSSEGVSSITGEERDPSRCWAGLGNPVMRSMAPRSYVPFDNGSPKKKRGKRGKKRKIGKGRSSLDGWRGESAVLVWEGRNNFVGKEERENKQPIRYQSRLRSFFAGKKGLAEASEGRSGR